MYDMLFWAENPLPPKLRAMMKPSFGGDGFEYYIDS
jgi:hypothetical protein